MRNLKLRVLNSWNEAFSFIIARKILSTFETLEALKRDRIQLSYVEPILPSGLCLFHVCYLVVLASSWSWLGCNTIYGCHSRDVPCYFSWIVKCELNNVTARVCVKARGKREWSGTPGGKSVMFYNLYHRNRLNLSCPLLNTEKHFENYSWMSNTLALASSLTTTTNRFYVLSLHLLHAFIPSRSFDELGICYQTT